MPFEKGKSGNSNGRPKGSENKATKKVRDKIAEFAESYVEHFVEDVKRVSADDPKGAADLFLKAIEYHIPKLAKIDSENTNTNKNIDLGQVDADKVKQTLDKLDDII